MASELGDYIVAVTPDKVMALGTAVPLLHMRFAARPSGLHVPLEHAKGPAPIDAMYHYITASQLLGTVPEPDQVVAHLARVPLADVLLAVAGWMAALHAPGASRREVDLRFADALQEPYRTRARRLLRDPSAALVAPQAWFVLAKLACVASGDALLPTTQPGDLLLAALVAAEHLGGDMDTGETVVGADPGPFARELVANQMFNSHRSEAHTFARFVRRWVQLPEELAADPRVLSLREVFEEATGVPLDDFIVVGCGLWAASSGGTPRLLQDYFDPLGLGKDRVDAVLSLVSTDLPHLRALVSEETRSFGLEWAISTFSRFPVIRLHDESLLVLDPALVVERMFGWLPLFDIADALERAGGDGGKRAGRVKHCLAHLSEVYAHEVLASIFDSGSSERLYDAKTLRRAYPAQDRKIADAAVDYGHSWAVFETTSSHPRRETVAGIADGELTKDLDKLVDEVAQIDSTIAFLRADESPVTGQPTLAGRRFTPILVVVDGFPINPVSLAHLRERVRTRGLLTGGDTNPLEVLDVEELEMVEALQEAPGGPSLHELLVDKRRGNFWSDSLRNHLIFTLDSGLGPPRRVGQLWQEVLKPALRRLIDYEAA